jgi:hypothetical protein
MSFCSTSLSPGARRRGAEPGVVELQRAGLVHAAHEGADEARSAAADVVGLGAVDGFRGDPGLQRVEPLVQVHHQQMVDPEGLLEYSVVYTDRALNHMSQSFQGVMKDIAAMLKQVYNAKSAIVVPGSGTFGMEAVARQFATDKKVPGDPQRLVQLPLDADLRDGPHPVGADRAEGAPAGAGAAQARSRRRRSRKWSPPSANTSPRRGVRTACRDGGRHDPARRLPARRRRRRARGRRPVRARLHRLGHDLGGHGRALGIDIVISAPQKGWSGSPCAVWSCWANARGRASTRPPAPASPAT